MEIDYKLIKDRRKTLGWSQAVLARLTGLSRFTIMRIEAGDWNPTLATYVKIYKVLENGKHAGKTTKI
jgi:predicted transcriptional regulator